MSSYLFLFTKKRLSNDDVGVAMDTVSQEIRPGGELVSKPDFFVQERLGGGLA